MEAIFVLLVIIASALCSLILLFRLFLKLSSDLQEYLLAFWSYKEMRWMVAACAVVYLSSVFFSSVVLPAKIEVTHKANLDFSHKLTGNPYSPIGIELKDNGRPIKVEFQNQ